MLSAEHRNKISIALKGRKISEEVRKRMSIGQRGKPATKGSFKIGNKEYLKSSRSFGKHWKLSETAKEALRHRVFSLETRKKMSISRSGIKNHRWKGGYANKLWHNRRRRIIKKGNGGYHTLNDWETLKAQYNWICPRCYRSEPTITLTEDHIIPLSRGGSDNIENIQPLCKSCNSSKNNRIVSY